MKKLKNLIIIFILFIIHANISYGTVAEKYTVSKAKNNGKMLFLLIGLALICMVLFLGYKMDKMEETIDRKKKYKKEKKEIILSERDIIENDDEKISEIEMDKADEYNNQLENIIEKEDESVEERKIENQELDLISNIFNNKDNDIKISVKGYDYDLENDIDLVDIENTIKAANIKKYTRKKDLKEVKENNEEKFEETTIKHYTRKINTDTKEKKTKRYTRKIQKSDDIDDNTDVILEDIIDNQIESTNKTNNVDENNFLDKIVDLDIIKEESETQSKPKSKRGRKPKKETESKDKEIEELPKSKRGRKPKAETKDKKVEEKPKAKRGRKPKIKTEEEELRQAIEMLPKSRRGRKPKAK